MMVAFDILNTKKADLAALPCPISLLGQKMKLNASEFHLSFDYQSNFASLVRRYVSPCIAVSVFLVKYKTTWKCPDIRFIGWE